ncbi:hypothetical protein HYV81_03125 [Candidatus Woesearchaeota archaeon]|nr:hypothetical protein [Candidatus Woesearchaeota archaeon]
MALLRLCQNLFVKSVAKRCHIQGGRCPWLSFTDGRKSAMTGCSMQLSSDDRGDRNYGNK